MVKKFSKNSAIKKMSLPSFNALYTFATVARLGSISAAADLLLVTPSAVSRQVKHLEQEIKGTLIERNGRGMRITALGKSLWRGIDPAFNLIFETVERTFQHPGHDVITLRVPPLFAMKWLIHRLNDFKKLTASNVTIMVHDLPASLSERVFPQGEFDTKLTIDWGRFGDNPNAEKLLDEEIFPVCHPKLTNNGSLAGLTLLHHERLPYSWNWPIDWSTFVAVTGLSGIDTTQGPRFSERLIINAACEGLGVAIANTSLVHDDLVAGRLIRPIAEGVKSDHAYWLLTPKSQRNLPIVMTFRTWLLDEIAKCFHPSPLTPHPSNPRHPRHLTFVTQEKSGEHGQE